MVPDIKIQEAVETYEPISETGADSTFRPRNLALGGLVSYAAFLVMASLGGPRYPYDPPVGLLVLLGLFALGGSILLIAAPIKWLLERRR